MLREINTTIYRNLSKRGCHHATLVAIRALANEVGSRKPISEDVTEDGAYVRFVGDIFALVINSFTEAVTEKYAGICGRGRTPRQAMRDLLKKLLEPTLAIPPDVPIAADEEVCLVVMRKKPERPVFGRIRQSAKTPRIGTIQ